MDQSTAVAVAFEVENPMQQVNATNPKQSKTNKKCFTCDCCKSFSFSFPSLPSLPSMPTCICCCGTTTSLQFFCCNSNNIIDPDHLILREERARINRLLTSDLNETKDNNCLECLLDCAFLPLLFKQPYSFHRCCCKNYCCVWIFRLFQCLFFIISTLNTLTIVAAPLMCDDTSFGFFPNPHSSSGPYFVFCREEGKNMGPGSVVRSDSTKSGGPRYRTAAAERVGVAAAEGVGMAAAPAAVAVRELERRWITNLFRAVSLLGVGRWAQARN